jgi:DNA-directed RNA polymerase
LPTAPKAKLKANSKKAIAARRRESKRRKLETESVEAEGDNEDNTEVTEAAQEEKNLESWETDTFGGFKWECVCINLPDYQEFCESLRKSKDPNEKALRERLLEEVIPVIEAAEEKRRRKIERRERELLMMERMVGAKRSSRLADKHDRERRDAEQAEIERKKQADLAAAHREQERLEKMEQERQYRMMTREQRIKDREYKRLLKEEELARDELEQKLIEEGQIRGSDRALKQRMERNKKELEDLDADEDWTFDCSGCGVYGKNLVSIYLSSTGRAAR